MVFRYHLHSAGTRLCLSDGCNGLGQSLCAVLGSLCDPGGKAFTGELKDHGVQISMDGKGRCMDNIFIERLWRSVKYEKIFLEEFETVPELLSGLKEYFKFYNFERPHQSLVGKTPAEIYYGREVARKAA